MCYVAIGHGPFSHLFDSQFIPQARKDGKEWKVSVYVYIHCMCMYIHTCINIHEEWKLRCG